LTCIVKARINYALLFMYKKCDKKEKERDLTFAMKKMKKKLRKYTLSFSFIL